MRNWTILGSAALIALAIYAASFTNRYEIAENGSGGNTFWRLDKMTGATEVCYFGKSQNPFDDQADRIVICTSRPRAQPLEGGK